MRNWIIQTNCFTDYDIDNLIEKVKDAGNTVRSGHYSFSDKSLLDDMPNNPVLYGSIQMCRQAQKLGANYYYIPGNFQMSAIIANWKGLCLNYDSIFLTFEQIKNNPDRLFNIFGDKIFLKPNLSNKSFTGFSTDRDNFQIEMNTMSLQNVQNDEIILVAKHVDIIHEWRFFIFEEVGCFSPYSWDGNIKEVDDYVLDFAENVSYNIWRPDEYFVLDVAETSEGLSVIEVNSINSSSLYGCDVQAFIKHMEWTS